ncbi:unnamed protein product [Porites evermanni]|uniref:Uncharacterized protein n=1 Tax=Porites evermanni TaxID=104178 RepID=A0ABN8SME6_9CNID|nr:unnamed protein product [Porites evermanni]
MQEAQTSSEKAGHMASTTHLMKEFFLETCPRGDFVGGKIVWLFTRFQLVNNHWVKSNKIVQFPMEGFDPSAFLAKPSRSGTSRAITSDGGVTTVNVKSSEELVNEEETEERKEATTQQGSEESSSQSSPGELSSSQVELNQNSKPPSRHPSCLSLNSAKVHPEVT